MLRALARRSIKAYPAQLAGHEVAQLPRLRELVLDCVECPHGDSLQQHPLDCANLACWDVQNPPIDVDLDGSIAGAV